jgi:hypothetical protein
MLESAGCEVEPYVYHPPEDEAHVPAYIAALARQRTLWELQHLHARPRSQASREFWRKFNRVWTPIQYIIGTVLSVCAICITFNTIKEGYSTMDLPPVAISIILVVLLILIAYCEGYPASFIILDKADKALFKESHPRAYHAHSLANAAGESFLVGRQILLTGIVFIFAQFTVFEIPEGENWIFFPASFLIIVTGSGITASLIVLAFGQLLPQLIAVTYPVHHMNLPGGYVLVWLMLFVDRLGVSNVAFWLAYAWRYLSGILVNEGFGVGGEVVVGVDKAGSAIATPTNAGEATGKGTEVVNNAQIGQAEANVGAHVGGEATAEIHRRVRKDPIQIAKCVFSAALMLGTTAVALKNIIEGQSRVVAHPAALIVIHIILLIAMTYCEGMNLCVLALEKVSPEQIALINPGAVAAHKLIAGTDGEKVKKYLLGRQFCVVWMVFIISGISGLWGLAITVFLAQVMPQIVAATNPAYYMARPGARWMILLCLAIEKIGVCHFGWLLGNGFTKLGEMLGILRHVKIMNTPAVEPVQEDAML